MRFVLSLFVVIGASTTVFANEPAAGRTEKSSPNQIGGTLIIAGGGKVHSILDSFVELAGGAQARIVLIPTASAKAERPELLTTFAYLQMKNVPVQILHTRDRKQANDPRFVEPLRGATGVWISGGDQALIIASYKDTLVEKELHRLLAHGKVVGGTSAGAAVMSSVMILGGNPAAQIGAGFGFLERVVVDQHFQNRNRLGRLLGVLGKHRDCLGVGIDECTAVFVNGRTAKVVGDANVRVCVPADIQKDNVRVLQPGDEFDLLDVYQSMIGENATAAD